MRILKQPLQLADAAVRWGLAAGLVEAGRRQTELIAQALDSGTQVLDIRPVWAFRRIFCAGLVDHRTHALAALLLPLLFGTRKLTFGFRQLFDRRLKDFVVSPDKLHVLPDHIFARHGLLSSEAPPDAAAKPRPV